MTIVNSVRRYFVLAAFLHIASTVVSIRLLILLRSNCFADSNRMHRMEGSASFIVT
jgi:hypothetical protein